MNNPKLFVGIILMIIGFVFICLRKNISKGMAKFYKKLYTEKNLKVMFLIAGIILIIGGLIIILSYL